VWPILQRQKRPADSRSVWGHDLALNSFFVAREAASAFLGSHPRILASFSQSNRIGAELPAKCLPMHSSYISRCSLLFYSELCKSLSFSVRFFFVAVCRVEVAMKLTVHFSLDHEAAKHILSLFAHRPALRCTTSRRQRTWLSLPVQKY